MNAIGTDASKSTSKSWSNGGECGIAMLRPPIEGSASKKKLTGKERSSLSTYHLLLNVVVWKSPTNKNYELAGGARPERCDRKAKETMQAGASALENRTG